MSSAQFEGLVRKRLVVELEKATGGRVDIATFHWRLLHLEAEADGLVIHGSEAPGEAPYARVDHLSAAVTLFGFWNPSVHIRNLDISRPSLHLIVYPDGATNQPHPRKPANTRNLDTLFNLQAGHVSVEQGVLDYDNRAAAFDFQNRWEPLDFQASDVSLLLRYIAASRVRAGNLSHRSRRHRPGSFPGRPASCLQARAQIRAHARPRLLSGHTRPHSHRGVSALAASHRPQQ